MHHSANSRNNKRHDVQLLQDEPVQGGIDSITLVRCSTAGPRHHDHQEDVSGGHHSPEGRQGKVTGSR